MMLLTTIFPFLLFLQLSNAVKLCDQEGIAIKHVINASRAACLDGSPPAFYLRSASANSQHRNNWLIYWEGGGWCYDLSACAARALHSPLGSSRHYPSCLGQDSLQHVLSNDREANPHLYNWNMVVVKYCDGGSYAGDVQQPVVHEGTKLYFRGAVNRAETLRALLNVGMRNAEEVVIVGCSAGALGVYLGIDEMTRIIHEEGRSDIIVRAMAQSGFFVDYRAEASSLDYGRDMRQVFHMMNVSAGADKECLRANPNHPSNCIFADALGPFISTPTFTLQSQYDTWERDHIYGQRENYVGMTNFGQHVLGSQLMNSLYSSSSVHGIYLHSCANHCTFCKNEDSWNGMSLMATSTDGNRPDRADHPRKFSPATAFQRWHQATKAFLSNIRQYLPPGSRLFIQNESYPCTHCCRC